MKAKKCFVAGFFVLVVCLGFGSIMKGTTNNESVIHLTRKRFHIMWRKLEKNLRTSDAGIALKDCHKDVTSQLRAYKVLDDMAENEIELLLTRAAPEYQKGALEPGRGPVGKRSSFSNDFNGCLFNGWPTNVLSGQVECPGQQLCYGRHGPAGLEQALFAVCYNTVTLIPEFTGHVLQSGGQTRSPPGVLTNPDDVNKEWISDATLGEVATHTDYSNFPQDFQDFSSAYSLLLARGHLTPNGDFSSAAGADSLTYTTTNCAPQWQPFNGGNWAKLEEGVRKYSKQKNRNLYIFTGTGGKALKAGKEIKLNGRVLTPRYYWKAVCDPQAPSSSPGTTGQSILFVAENKPGDTSTRKVQGDCAAITKQQTEKFGVINCYSLVDAKTLFPDISANLPSFGAGCNPDILGNFMNGFLNKVQ